MKIEEKQACPKCYKERVEYKEKLQKKADEDYGVVTSDEYVKLRSDADISLYMKDTLKQKIGTSLEEYKLIIAYTCSCEVCGFFFSDKREIAILE